MNDVSASAQSADRSRVPADLVRVALTRILESPEFRASKRCQDFLRYVVETSLQGHADQLKERTIGIEVFGRPTSYDPSSDATVRVKAGEVRRRLATYYAGPGATDSLRIVLPAGGYSPEFAAAHQPTPSLPEVAVAQGPSKRVWSAGVLMVVACVAAIVGYRWVGNSGGASDLRRFWSPALQSNTSMLLCVAYVPVYGLDQNVERSGGQPKSVADFVELPEDFVGGGDLLAVAHISGMLNKMGRQHQVKVGSDVSSRELRSSPAVLIGYSYTRWKELSQGPRFLLDTAKSPKTVTDGGKPTGWSLSNLPRAHRADEDYAIVSRIFHPDTGTMLVVVSGFTQYGTEAASELVTNQVMLQQALSGAPSDWAAKNLQFVLHVKVISGAPGTPEVVASHYW